MNRYIAVTILLLGSFLGGCATLPGVDAPTVRVIGLEPLQGEGLEIRFALKLRVQNPNESALAYEGMSVSLDLDGQGLASGVSDVTGEIPRFSDAVLTVPVSISAFNVVRQVLARAKQSQSAGSVSSQPVVYRLTGKLGAPKGGFRATRFSDSGELDLFSSGNSESPQPAPAGN